MSCYFHEPDRKYFNAKCYNTIYKNVKILHESAFGKQMFRPQQGCVPSHIKCDLKNRTIYLSMDVSFYQSEVCADASELKCHYGASIPDDATTDKLLQMYCGFSSRNNPCTPYTAVVLGNEFFRMVPYLVTYDNCDMYDFIEKERYYYYRGRGYVG